MMTQPIRTFKDLMSETTPAGGNTKINVSFDEQRLLEMRARYARAELVAHALTDAILWVSRQAKRLVSAIREDFKLRAAEAQLWRMTDRELADLGLTRAEIPFAVRETAHGVAPALDRATDSVEAANQNLRRAA
jgi:uncharacterized protein YjiS (DUF1127 family)